jgi:GT2 family glycosyltransferase
MTPSEALAVSAVIPTYNRAHLVGRAVASALAAIAPGDEIIVVDDGSTDDTEAALAPYRDRIRYVRTDNRGAGAARNRGVREARHPLVAFLDSDDEWMPDKLRLQRTVMARRPDVLYCFSDFATRDADGREHRFYLAQWQGVSRGWEERLGPAIPFSSLGPLPSGRPDLAVRVGDLYPAMMQACYVSTITVMARRDAGEALHFAEDLPLYEDWECFARLARAGRGAYLACETAWNHGHRGPRLITASPLVAATARITLLQRLWGADAAFQAIGADQYRRTLAEQRLARARAFIGQGQTDQAREELRLAGGGPLTHRALAALPGALARRLVAAGRALRRA